MSDFLTGLSDAVGNGLGSLGFGRAALTGFWDAMRPAAGAGFSSPLATSFWGALQPSGSGNPLGGAFWGALASGGNSGGQGSPSPMGLFQSPTQQFGLGFTQGAQQGGFANNNGSMGSPASAGAAIDQWDAQFAAGIQTIAGIEQVTVPINLVKALVGEESQGVMAPCNGAGYCGLMQVGLPSAQGGGSDCDTASFDISTVQGNINCGVQELARGYKRCGTWQGALSAYYTGQCDCPDCHDDPSLGGSGETATTYVGHIWDHYQQLQQSTGYAGSDPAFAGSGSIGFGGGPAPAGTTEMSAIWGNQGDPGITQPFGVTDFSQANCGSMYAYAASYGVPCGHPGDDVGVAFGTQLYSPVNGTVVCAGSNGVGPADPSSSCSAFCCSMCDGGGCGAGQGRLEIALADGTYLILGHMSQITAQVGQQVTAGTPVGYSGGENGAHVHVEYRVPGNCSSGMCAVDPAQALGGAYTGGFTAGSSYGSTGASPAGTWSANMAFARMMNGQSPWG